MIVLKGKALFALIQIMNVPAVSREVLLLIIFTLSLICPKLYNLAYLEIIRVADSLGTYWKTLRDSARGWRRIVTWRDSNPWPPWSMPFTTTVLLLLPIFLDSCLRAVSKASYNRVPTKKELDSIEWKYNSRRQHFSGMKKALFCLISTIYEHKIHLSLKMQQGTSKAINSWWSPTTASFWSSRLF